MNANSQRPKRREVAVSSLNAAIDALNVMGDMTPIKTVFCSVSMILTMIRVRFLLLCNNQLQAHAQTGLNG